MISDLVAFAKMWGIISHLSITFNFDLNKKIGPHKTWNAAYIRFPAEHAISRGFGLPFFLGLRTPLRTGVTEVKSIMDGATRAEPLPNNTPDKQGSTRFLISVCATNTNVTNHPKSEGACLVKNTAVGRCTLSPKRTQA